MQKLWRCGLAFALSLPLVSCVDVVMQRPLSDDATSVFDDQLFGSWKFDRRDATDREDWTMFIGRQDGTRATYKIVGVGLQKEQKTIEVDESVVRAYSRIGTNRYLSALFKDKQRSPYYLVLKYDFPDKNTLRISLLGREPLAKAIAAGKIQGRIGTKNNGDVELTDSPDAVFQFLEQHSRECFPPEDVKLLKRVS